MVTLGEYGLKKIKTIFQSTLDLIASFKIHNVLLTYRFLQ